MEDIAEDREPTVNWTVTFTDAVKSALTAEGVDLTGSIQQRLPAVGFVPQIGDRWCDKRLSQHIFLVAGRCFTWNDAGDVTFALVLAFAPEDGPTEFVDNVLPLTR